MPDLQKIIPDNHQIQGTGFLLVLFMRKIGWMDISILLKCNKKVTFILLLIKALVLSFKIKK